MSVQAQILRLENAKADIISAIAEKGVTVPQDVLLDEIADYIRQIKVDNSPNFTVSDDGNGNVIITAEMSVTDDNNGNVTIISAIPITDDGNGNVKIG